MRSKRVKDRKECVAWKSEMSKILRTRGRIDEESRLESNIEHQIVNEKKHEENYQLEMLEGAKLIGAGAAIIALAGAAIGFALTEAIASFALMMSFLISSVFRSKNQRKKMNLRVDKSDLDAAVAPRRYEFHPLLPTPGHHSMSGIRGDILDITTPLVGGCVAPPFDRYIVEEADHECYRCGSDLGQADKAGIKAMLDNRVGDFGLAPGILGCFTLFQTVDFSTIFACVSVPRNSSISHNMRLNAITLICILLLIGAAGKSTQIGSHTWSPDAIEGPTPVSTLIHAATMVIAGIFMIARCSPLFEYPHTALIVITFVGAMTSFLATTTRILQNDLNRVIAYSTCSQLGYMIFACGISNYLVSVFHLMNHAFLKAILFMSAGLVIHAMPDKQDMQKMGGLASSFPFTYTMMLMGRLSLIVFPSPTGFYSKDVILELAYTKYTMTRNFAFWLGSVFVLFTSYYSFRSLFLTFLGPTNSFERDIDTWPKCDLLAHKPLLIPLSFGLATVFPKRSVSLVSRGPDPRRPRANTHRLRHGLPGLVIDILEKLVKSRQTLSKAMVARNGFSQVIDSPYGRLA
ncbi:NADH dehydrogenase subunit 5 [Tanacetum coccineum]